MSRTVAGWSGMTLSLLVLLVGCGPSGRGAESRAVLLPVLRAVLAADGQSVTLLFEDSGCGAIAAQADGSSGTILVRLIMQRTSAKCSRVVRAGQRNVEILNKAASAPANVVDAATGRPVPMFDGAKLAAVRWLPPGYSFARDSFDSLSGLRYTDPAEPPTWGRVYVASADRPEIVVMQAIASSVPLVDWPVTRRIRIGGLDGAVYLTGQSVALGWRTANGSFAVTAVVTNQITQQPASVDDLRRVAENVGF